MSYNAWKTTSLHPLTLFLCHAIILSLAPYNDVNDVVVYTKRPNLRSFSYLRLYNPTINN